MRTPLVGPVQTAIALEQKDEKNAAYLIYQGPTRRQKEPVWYTLLIMTSERTCKLNRPFQQSTLVHKNNSIRARLEWTFFVVFLSTLSLDWAPLFAGMRERFICQIHD